MITFLKKLDYETDVILDALSNESVRSNIGFWIGFIAYAVVMFYATKAVIHTKNQMCKDFGRTVYHRELSWFECLVL